MQTSKKITKKEPHDFKGCPVENWWGSNLKATPEKLPREDDYDNFGNDL